MEREMKEFEEAVRRVHGTEDGDSMEQRMLKDKKADLTRRRSEVRRLMNEEILLSQDVATEQARWTELNQRLEDLERALVRR